jgi:ribose transport system ATP-binding protein
MTINARPYAPANPSEARHAGVAMIQQELSLAADLTVVENITLGIEPARYGVIDRARARAVAAAALAELGHTDLPLDAPAGSLSAALQQVVEIARALAVGCPVLVLDEPTSSLGPHDVERLFAVLRRLKAQGHAIVYISHFIEEVMRITDRFVVLRDGRNVGGGRTAEATHDDIVALMVGTRADHVFPRSRRHRGDPLLEVERLEPGAASFTVHRGEILGIAGLMGSGRTRLLRALFGLAPVRSGRVRIGVVSTAGAPPAARWRQGLGLVSEDRTHEGVSLQLSVADNLTLTRLGPFGRAGVVSPRLQRAAARGWIDRLHIRCAGETQPIGELSGGNQQKVALARLLHHDVDVLVLDEPTRGIDVGSKAQIYRHIDELVSDRAPRPRAILMVSSYLPELLGLCDRIAVMRRGQLGEPREASRFTEHTLMAAIGGAA